MNPTSINQDSIRRVFESALGDDRLKTVSDEEPLVRSGVVSSIELVEILVALEKAFGVKISDSSIDIENFSIDWVKTNLLSEPDSKPPCLKPNESFSPFRSFCHFAGRPLIAISLTALFFLILNGILQLAVLGPLKNSYMAFLEGGKRFYPCAGNLSHDDISYASHFHEIRQPPTKAERRVLVLGDSGTIGSFTEAQESVPSQLDSLMHGKGPIRVFNAAWFAQSLVKDFMILETVWDTPFDVVIFTLRDRYFSTETVNQWTKGYGHVYSNADLLEAFSLRIPESERQPFRDISERLERTAKRNIGSMNWVRKLARPIYRFGPYLRSKFDSVYMPGLINSDTYTNCKLVRNQRYAMTRTEPELLSDGFEENEIDKPTIAMLSSAVKVLRSQGKQVIFYLEPNGPREWRPKVSKEFTVQKITRPIAEENSVPVVDTTWLLSKEDFTDSQSHYTPEGNRKIALELSKTLAEVLP